jgi:hypothetical protein
MDVMELAVIVFLCSMTLSIHKIGHKVRGYEDACETKRTPVHVITEYLSNFRR